MNTKYLTFLLLLFMLSSCTDIEKVNLHYIYPQCISGQSNCSVITSFGLINIKFNVETVIPENPFIVVVELNHQQELKLNGKLKITGYLEGKNMYMGKIPLFFSETDNKEIKKENFQADVLLGSCSENEMIWRMWLIITDDNGGKETIFIDFTSIRD